MTLLPERIDTARLRLRPMGAGDRAAVVETLSDWEVARWLRPTPFPYTDNDFSHYLHVVQPGSTWAIEDGEGFAGTIALTVTPQRNSFGYWILPSRQRRGYATEAAEGVLAAAASRLPHLAISSLYFEGNAPSARVLEKSGFRETGRTTIFARSHGKEVPAVTLLRPAPLTIRDATPEDLPAIRDIYNAAVRETTAIWNEVEVDLPNRQAWLAARTGLGYPVLVAVDGAQVLGYASYGDWRAFDGYRATVEHSVYVTEAARGRGVGRGLLLALADRARLGGKHVMVGAVEAGNTASLALHRALGFRETGVMRHVGQKFGRWLDLAWVELVLDDRPSP